MNVAVVGGGIAGLSAAWELADHASVTLFEPDRLGGKVLTERFDGRDVDCGPDAFITRTPDAVELCQLAGVDDLVSPAVGRTLIWWRGRLRQIPDGLVLGAPRRLMPLVTSGILSPYGVVRAAADLVLPRRGDAADVSVRDLVRARFGEEVADRLVDPLVGGIYAGRTEVLSAAAATPQLVEAARRRSLLAGLRRLPSAPRGSPMFLAPRMGLGRLVDALVESLSGRSVRFVPHAVTSVRSVDGVYRMEPGGEAFDSVVLATNAATSARILGGDTAPGLRSIRSASVALVTLGYSGLVLPPGVNGVLVPRSPDWLMTACSFASAKWPHWARPGRQVLRVSVGRDGDERALAMSDRDLVARLTDEVARALGQSAVPDVWRVTHFPDSFPQYEVGHPALIGRITDDLRRTHPNVRICGASYHGIGIPACIASGRAAARGVLDAVRQRA